MEHVECLVITFNCGRTPVKPEVLARHLAGILKGGPTHKVIALSLQEICPMPYGFIGGRCVSFYYQGFKEAIKIATGDNLYTNVFTKNLGITALMVFVHNDHKDRVGSIESASTGVGWYEMGNKGAVGAKLGWVSETGTQININFIAAHLAPHEWALERRNQDWMHIVQRLVFESAVISKTRHDINSPDEGDAAKRNPLDSDETRPLLAKDNDSSLESHDSDNQPSTIYSPISYTFVAGDLNYRTSDTGPGPEDYSKYPKLATSKDSIQTLFKNDQLKAEMKAGKTMQGFKESEINFLPTYKYASKTQERAGEQEDHHGSTKDSEESSDTSLGYALHRWPSWCDRILYLAPFVEPAAKEANIRNNFYKSLPLMSTSDHQAVVASFSIPIETPISASDKRLADLDDYRVKAPYAVDPQWRQRFAAARRKELILGILAYLGITWEGNSILLALLVGAASSYAAIKSGAIRV